METIYFGVFIYNFPESNQFKYFPFEFEFDFSHLFPMNYSKF